MLSFSKSLILIIKMQLNIPGGERWECLLTAPRVTQVSSEPGREAEEERKVWRTGYRLRGRERLAEGDGEENRLKVSLRPLSFTHTATLMKFSMSPLNSL